jgi:hypothetical protein
MNKNYERMKANINRLFDENLSYLVPINERDKYPNLVDTLTKLQSDINQQFLMDCDRANLNLEMSVKNQL